VVPALFLIKSTFYMLITINKQVEETIEVKTPCWLANKLGFYAHITEGGDLIEVYGNSISLREGDNPSTPGAIAGIVEKYHSCTEMEFKEALDKRLFKIEETYTKAV
jgi:hypothetical protein